MDFILYDQLFVAFFGLTNFHFLVYSGDHTVKITDCQTGKCLKVLSGHRRTPWVVSFLVMQIIFHLFVLVIPLLFCLIYGASSYFSCCNFLIVSGSFGICLTSGWCNEFG